MASRTRPPLAEFEWAPNGLNKFTIALRENGQFMPLAPNTEMFTSLAVAVNIGIEMLETASGRHTLLKLGRRIVEARASNKPPIPFYGDITMMDTYVDHFLDRVRSDLPRFIVEDRPSLDQLADTSKGHWEGDFSSFKPKQAGSITFNLARVKSMVRSHGKYEALRSGSSAQWRPYLDRWQGFLFMFACATAHELAHLFVCYLSLGKDVHTPRRVVHLDYHQAVMVQGQRVIVGESGRWLEAALYGGSLEYFRDVKQGPDQTGIAYILDANVVAYEIPLTTIKCFVENPRRYVFPLEVSRPGLTEDQVKRSGLRSMGSTGSARQLPAASNTMSAGMRGMRSFETYSIGIERLRQRTSNPSLTLAIKVC
ncbi:hypothetical protein VFPPC_08938 [Pochonia chlamydosporia 170]|uniref:Uncharacterized protein n=1 Tax=Pochonia chlamydosporia 170 TaxID=1380566 RepID=A0A179FC13_METCM|nr:hypothetical protein VFPPC_08938 [Pochonia chlamydosporia 170]OAQ63024.1 hypothetical protein VFPPC_08938 [Pochonia chlamydosporia 170]